MASPTPAPAITFVLTLLMVGVQVLILHYLLRLERIGCQCALDWRRDYILFYLGLLVVLSLVNLFFSPYVASMFQFSMFVLGLFNVAFTLQYVHRLKEEKCACSLSVYREVMYVLAVVNAFLYGLVFLFLLLMLFSISHQLGSPTAMRPVKNVNVRKVVPVKVK